MDAETIQKIGIQTCNDMLEQITAMQKGNNPKENNLVSMVINDVKKIVKGRNHITLYISRGIAELDNLGLCIENTEQKYYFCDNTESDLYISFQSYDSITRTLIAIPSKKLLSVIDEHPIEDIKVIVDMKWLIELTNRTFKLFGSNIGYPKFKPNFKLGEDYDFPRNTTPSKQQIEAVNTILNNKLSYIWGAPGTGKTQYVLATAVIAYVKKGGRVAIFAPTNNSVEQVLRGVLKELDADDPNHEYINPKKDILRMGSATAAFINEFKELCEDKAINQQIETLKQTIATINTYKFERNVNLVMSNFDQIEALYEEEYDHASFQKKKEIEEQIADYTEEIRVLLNTNPNTAGLMANIDEKNIRQQLNGIRTRVMNRERPELDIEEYGQMDDEELNLKITECLDKIESLKINSTEYRQTHVKILAMTPFTLMSRISLFDEDGIPSMDHIFLDEAGYANLIQTMPLFMCGPPVTMLGDHMQLPPVCEVGRERFLKWSARKGEGYMKYGFMWDQSARYIESFLTESGQHAIDDYRDEREPTYHETKVCNLTVSHRFANNLAKILDQCVYKNGISGHNGDSLNIYCYDIVGTNADRRLNMEEANAVIDYVHEYEHELGNFAIITPYKSQKNALIHGLREFEDSIMTIHGSQGREWDTVIITVCDNRKSEREIPYRFTSSLPPNSGLRVINTAVSRAKKNLILFCDYEFWKERGPKGDLLGMIVNDPDVKVINHG